MAAILFHLICSLVFLLQLGLTSPIDQQVPLQPYKKHESYSPYEQHESYHSSQQHLDAAPDTVGVLFGTEDEDDAIHLWLPLGKRVFTRDNSGLPLRPMTARITTTIASAPERASDEFLDAIQCSVYPRIQHPGRESFGGQEYAIVNLSKLDGLVSFSEEYGDFWLHGTEVEAYHCS